MENCKELTNLALHRRVNTDITSNAQDLLVCEASQTAQRVQVVNQNPAFARIANARSLLFLQGPVGHLFGKLANWLLNRGAKVHRVVFNGGDAWYARSLPKEKVFSFDMPMDSWPSTFCRLCSLHSVDVMVLFGQSRPCHAPIIAIARKMGLDVVVVEEGYFRPGFATFELGGVNGSSSTLEIFSWQSSTNSISELDADVCNLHFLKTCFHASLYYVMLFLRQSRFIHYRHHRDTFFITYAYYWLRSWKVKLQRRAKDHALVNSLIKSGMDFFFVPLQHEDDAQVTQHSTFSCNKSFINLVVRSFAKNALPDQRLIFKQHPMSRGGVGLEKFIHDLAFELGIEKLVSCVWEGHNPSILDACQGVVLINSTVGLQALQRGKAVKVLGTSLYDLPNVTSQQTLDEFWRKPQKPDLEISRYFLQQLKHLTQVPCSIYSNTYEAWSFLKTQ